MKKLLLNKLVKIIAISDETGNKSYLGQYGKIKYFDYVCGCGQSYPNDPMIGIEFNNGKIEEFWKEELKIV